ncbi:MAG: nucleotidyl transferase AbiEii/AbiGii toxin family protein [Candidatus Parabeggiatoa sp. nov. 3]|nr:MAG: nucleotidyl transferase AbiEii/AbiGii toxin family protein [Gammaproteobacteria bacterium]RKZ69236.1 MAG: nucleotidyl transferase AbiEii/AbiGii toxin family protein [Gammaproteobacteria bacterium]RKZ85153.1 MAG: nucleotidyl transferase AbiEii/AbiGii toxin family protein [Gammaproteobacteria bacterium]
MFSIIEKRLNEYEIDTEAQQENALKEITQEIILSALAEAHFFDVGIFHGGTSLRICYGLERFSEDLDFLLKQPDSNFKWQPYSETIKKKCTDYGIELEMLEKRKETETVKKMFLKHNSIGNLFNLSFKRHPKQKIKIKLEVDTNPPIGSKIETKLLTFPLDFSIDVQNLPSNFANKSHALLCRKYDKGRDWYDFDWYVSKNVIPNFTLLTQAINQIGPWENQGIEITPAWYLEQLAIKIQSLNWKELKKDVKRFVEVEEHNKLELWHVEFFMKKLEKLEQILIKPSISG